LDIQLSYLVARLV